MAIKVVVNYPKTEEGMQLLKESQAIIVVNILRDMLTPKKLGELKNILKKKLIKQKV